jgi:hypothetical protein
MTNDTFASAHDKYVAMCADDGEEFQLLTDRLSSYSEAWELSEIEAALFAIDPKLANALSPAYLRYENFTGPWMSSSMNSGSRSGATSRPFSRANGYRITGQAVGFMVSACGLPQTQCMGWVCKTYAAELRGGLYDPR